jgi:hypothetical protein
MFYKKYYKVKLNNIIYVSQNIFLDIPKIGYIGIEDPRIGVGQDPRIHVIWDDWGPPDTHVSGAE